MHERPDIIYVAGLESVLIADELLWTEILEGYVGISGSSMLGAQKRNWL